MLYVLWYYSNKRVKQKAIMQTRKLHHTMRDIRRQMRDQQRNIDHFPLGVVHGKVSLTSTTTFYQQSLFPVSLVELLG